MSKVQVGADRNRANRFGVKVAFVFLKALVPGILLCLSVSSTAAQANAKNVLVLFSSVKYSEAFRDAVEPFIRSSGSSGRSRFMTHTWTIPRWNRDLIGRAWRRLCAAGTPG